MRFCNNHKLRWELICEHIQQSLQDSDFVRRSLVV